MMKFRPDACVGSILKKPRLKEISHLIQAPVLGQEMAPLAVAGVAATRPGSARPGRPVPVLEGPRRVGPFISRGGETRSNRVQFASQRSRGKQAVSRAISGIDHVTSFGLARPEPAAPWSSPVRSGRCDRRCAARGDRDKRRDPSVRPELAPGFAPGTDKETTGIVTTLATRARHALCRWPTAETPKQTLITFFWRENSQYRRFYYFPRRKFQVPHSTCLRRSSNHKSLIVVECWINPEDCTSRQVMGSLYRDRLERGDEG